LTPAGNRMLIGRSKDVSTLARIQIVLNWTQLLDHAK